MRAWIWLVVAACGGHGGMAMPDAPQLPAWASVEAGALVARCAGTEVTVAPLAGGLVHVRYGAEVVRSWAVVGAPAADPAATFAGDGDGALVTTSAIAVRVDPACRVRATLADGTVMIDDAATFAVGDTARLVRNAPADRVYGLGERTGGLDRRGRTWTFWNTDAYDPAFGGWKPMQDPLYQSIALEVHQAGATSFGVFTDATRRMTIALGGGTASRDMCPASSTAEWRCGSIDQIDVTGARSIDQFLIAGPRMADVLDRYTQLTGRPMRPPRWALGFHQSRWGYNTADEVEQVAAQYRALGIPADAIWLDIQHLRGFRTFTFDPDRFADPAGLVARLAARGFRVITIEDPGIKVDPGWDVYDTGMPHYLRRADGTIYTGTGWAGASVFPDLSSAPARAWWGDQLRRVLDVGVAGIWLDVNEPTTFPEGGGGTTVPDELPADGDGAPTTMAAVHNAYGLFEARATYEALAAARPGESPFVLSRAGYAGIQRYAAVWTGDTPSTWDGLQQTLPMLLGLGVSGVPIVGSDIGGYSGHATPELYARWLALGSISPFARAHVTSNVPGQEPWQFGIDVTDAARDWLTERYRLLPYLYSLADEASRTGAPVLRPLVWEFPDDPAVADLADEAMLGPSILVAPVVEQGATTRRVYLPAGRWFEYGSDRITDGPATIDVDVRLQALPMFVRSGAIIPATDVVEIYGAGGTFTRFDDPGTTTIATTARADGMTITSSQPITVRVHRVDSAPDGLLVAAVAGTTTLTFDPAVGDPAPPVSVPFEVHAPGPGPVYVASSATAWTHVPLAQASPGVWRGALTAPRGTWIDYKFTRGDWSTVEKQADCTERANRSRMAAPGARVDTVAAWRDGC